LQIVWEKLVFLYKLAYRSVYNQKDIIVIVKLYTLSL